MQLTACTGFSIATSTEARRASQATASAVARRAKVEAVTRHDMHEKTQMADYAALIRPTGSAETA
jgi:hypothetical protein